MPNCLIEVLVNRFKDSVNDKNLFIPIGIVSFIISFYAIHKEWLNLIQGSGYSYYHNIILTVSVCGLLLPVFFIKFNNHYLSNIGKSSFSIYLFHVFFTSSSRLLFNVIYTLLLFVLIPSITYISVWIPLFMAELLRDIYLC